MKFRRTWDHGEGAGAGAARGGVEALEGRVLLAGNGLTGVYYDNANLSGASVARTDAAVNFDWGMSSPAAGIGADTFSVRWTGQVQARFTQLYTFSTDSDDGVRLWVNGKLIIDDWNPHARKIDRGQVFLTQGQRYDVKLEYFDQVEEASVQLWWNSHTQRGQIIPQAYLFSSTPVTPPDSVPPTPVTAPLRVSSNGRYLVKSDGSPFFYMADTAWTMPVQLNRADVDLYLKTRAAQGFNVVQMVATDEHYAVKNRYGQAPLLNNNPSTPNDAFFDHVDYIVKRAADFGITVGFMPTWGRNVADVDYRIFNAKSAYDYGRFLGARYKNSPNVIWMNGGDWALADSATTAIWRAIAQGLTDGDGGAHLMTFHPKGGDTARGYWGNESWLDFSMTQSGHRRDSAAWDLIANDYNQSSVRPVLDGEINYERMPVNAVEGTLRGPLMDDYDVRKKAYWTVFAGGAGVAYGSNEVFQFYVPGTRGGTRASMDWHEAINLPGATQMKLLRSLVEVRAYLSRVPDQSVVTSSTYTGTDHIQATRDANGSFALVYSGSGKAFSVNMGKITGGRVEANWYNPRTGKRTAIGVYANSGTKRFTPPTQGYGQDWVLMLDRA